VGDSVRPVGVEGSWPKDGLVSDWDLVLACGRKLYDLSDIVLTLRRYSTTIIKHRKLADDRVLSPLFSNNNSHARLRYHRMFN